MSRPIRLGIQLWPLTANWPSLENAGRLVDSLGFDYLFAWDHMLSPVGDPEQPTLDGYAVIAAWAVTTRRAKLGLLVGANTFRNPALVAKTATTIDRISGGRMVLALGGAWNEREHNAFGIDFGSGFGERLDWLEEALTITRRLLRGERVTHQGPRYRLDEARLAPGPLGERIPIMVGGAGERKTLRSVARHADIWTAGLGVDTANHKLATLRGYCTEIGRDISEIELAINCHIVIRPNRGDAREALVRLYGAHGLEMDPDDPIAWWGTPGDVADRLRAYLDLGFTTFITALPPPYDQQTLHGLTEVRSLLGDSIAIPHL